ncbi:M4 family metallopeptidase [Kitasatospora sp. NPDC001603]|uniref:M4 family metallopeptidase n=1 Tax=Kitasatospora sp. NPDC001603 TaxID=3154388 RepID=UPI0033188D52
MTPSLRTGLPVLIACSLVISVMGAAASAVPSSSHNRPAPVSQEQAGREAIAAVHATPEASRAGTDDAFSTRRVQVEANGTRHVHLDRTYRGLPVLGGDVIVHSAADGRLDSASLTLAAPLNLSTTPTVTADQAIATALSRFTGTRTDTSATLKIDALGADPRLVWESVIEGTAPDQAPSRFHVLVDALTGQAGASWDTYSSFLHDHPVAEQSKPAAATRSHQATADAAPTGAGTTAAGALGTGHGFQVGNVSLSSSRNSNGYTLIDPNRGNGETRDAGNRTAPRMHPPAGWGTAFTDSDNVWGNGALNDRATVAVDAHYGIQATWDFYKNVLGRNGIRGDGVGARSFVHYGTNYPNAGWDDASFSMIYGDGPGGSAPFTQIDVAGHEMTHGVTAATAGLVYSGDAGGLNEATSDIMGTMVEFNAANPADTPDYLIGEKLNIHGNGTPLRWMDDPAKDGRSVSCWSGSTRNLDPHFSSGIGNHFFYLLAVGSGSSNWGTSPTCNRSNLTGIGNNDATRIWYRALTTYMTSNTDYPGARTATVNAARDLFGRNSTRCRAVEAAWSGVGVAPTASTCNG